MPEGDTIYRTAAALHRALAGHEVTRFSTVYAHLSRVHDQSPITGRTVERAEPRGKHLLIWLSGALALRTHMRMSGSWHLYRPGERWQRSPGAMRIELGTSTWTAVAFDVQEAEFVEAADLPRHRQLSRLGPDLLSASLDRAAAAARLAAGGPRAIGAVLLDQRVVAGIGNVYRNEVLFLCGIHPDRPAGEVGLDACLALVDTAVRLMHVNVAASSGAIATRPGLRRTTGRLDGHEHLWVYDRRGRPCRRCGTPIAGGKRGNDARATYWCPRCQPRA